MHCDDRVYSEARRKTSKLYYNCKVFSSIKDKDLISNTFRRGISYWESGSFVLQFYFVWLSEN